MESGGARSEREQRLLKLVGKRHTCWGSCERRHEFFDEAFQSDGGGCRSAIRTRNGERIKPE
jgi:hypothetical protein